MGTLFPRNTGRSSLPSHGGSPRGRGYRFASPHSPALAIDANGDYTVGSGTSFATPKVAGIAVRCLEFLMVLERREILGQWQQQAIKQNNLPNLSIKISACVIKQMIEYMASPLPPYGQHAAGHGFVEDGLATQYFYTFSLSQFLKVFHYTEKTNDAFL